ncbi:MAG: amidohydrolase family protein [Succinivibrionaceae bacterium]|nr:amidohydrolase family protein [Succinivibrionaceae bacterium]
MFFDSHIHNKSQENGGFLIGLEGFPNFENTLNNNEALKLHNPNEKYISFYYVTKSFIENKINHSYLKFHPRREQYSPNEVIKSILINNPRCVIIDTLNEPFWQSYDYWRIAKIFSDIPFLFSHSGGYLINEFIKICHFQKNVWIDFSLTHTLLGKLGEKNGLLYVNDAINYALNSSFSERVLMGSDYPFFDQNKVVEFYKNMNKLDFLNENYLNLLGKIK